MDNVWNFAKPGQMAKSTRGNSSRINDMATVSFTGRTDDSTKVAGKTESSMGKGNSDRKTASCFKAFGNTDSGSNGKRARAQGTVERIITTMLRTSEEKLFNRLINSYSMRLALSVWICVIPTRKTSI